MSLETRHTGSSKLRGGASISSGSLGPSYKWWVVFMLWWVCFLNYADRQAIGSVVPLLARDFEFDAVQLGLIGSSFAWVYALMAPTAGLMADRAVRKRLLVWACVVWSFFTLATAWCGNLWMFVTVRALTGLGETFYFPAAMALISDYHGSRSRSRAMSWHQSAVYAGTILGSWIAALLAERQGWRVPFFLFGPLGFALAVVLWQCLREPQRGAAEDPNQAPLPESGAPLSVGETLRQILRTPAALLLMGAFLCANFVAVIFLTWTPTFLVQKFHYNIGAAGLTGTFYIHLASALAVPFAGWLADRLVRHQATGRMLVQTLGLLAGAAFVFVVGNTDNTTTLLLAMTCFGLCKGFYDSGIFASLYDAIEPRARGTAAGLMNSIGWGGGALGPLFVGFASKYGGKPSALENMSNAIAFGALFYLAAAACLIGAMLVFRKRNRLTQKWPTPMDSAESKV
ncbi:MAG TPA: MFS transporter [Candidatus Binatia bacterium]|jgi:MFS family permease|nr:MFS transporter [Candidatus Binatia bacterium]